MKNNELVLRDNTIYFDVTFIHKGLMTHFRMWKVTPMLHGGPLTYDTTMGIHLRLCLGIMEHYTILFLDLF
jgi:hypothetical protein